MLEPFSEYPGQGGDPFHVHRPFRPPSGMDGPSVHFHPFHLPLHPRSIHPFESWVEWMDGRYPLLTETSLARRPNALFLVWIRLKA